ncbi:ABC multidrug transporter [Pleurostoma richardsiae]|uniref:ABC multidrug transporter n=1 Tax=Pleurostoma richardsiae TaxID=41990 RepID=A0AA38VC41_9PEZI|nr:ABC multidrug transporter [Pleurostoma richardsiae]
MSNVSSAVGCFPTADEAFGPAVHSCRDDFDFTISFEQYFFSIAPAALLLLVAPLRLRYLSKLPAQIAGGTTLRLAKVAAVAIFATLQLTLVGLWAAQSSDELGRVRTNCLAASCVSFVASVMFCALSYIEHAKSLKPSPVLNAYLFISVILDAAIVRTFWLTPFLANPIRAVFTASLALKVALLVLEAKEKAEYAVLRAAEGRNPEATSGLYSHGVFWWMTPLLLDGFRRLLKPADLYNLDEDMSAVVLNERFWSVWNSGRYEGQYRLIWVCIKTLKWQTLMVVAPRLVLLGFTICQPVILNRFLDFLQDPLQNVNYGYGLIGAYGLVYLGIAVSSSFYYHRSYRAATMLRGILVSAIFTRSTDLSTTALDNKAAVTLMSTDVEAIVRAIREIHEFWANILQIGLATWLLSLQIGYGSAGPVLVCVLTFGMTAVLAPITKRATIAWIEKVQVRVGITSTMLGHMKSIKMSGLSQKLGSSITNLRLEEVKTAFPLRLLGAVSSSVAQMPQLISPVVAFAFFTIKSVRSGDTLDVTKMFSSLSLIILLGSPLFIMMEVVMELNSAVGCFDRIQKFLSGSRLNDYRETSPESSLSVTPPIGDSTLNLSPHLPEDIELRNLQGPRPSSIRTGDYFDEPTASIKQACDIHVRNASFGWSAGSKPVVENINLAIPTGQFAALIGPVASGKSTLLKGLLGEVPVASGYTHLTRQRLSWCEQSPWLTNNTIRKNIVGFSVFDSDLYHSVVHACDLDKDLAQMENGDETVIGSKGIVLSGGQKQRVALARAVYSRPRIALFDDIFSGLDNRTAETIFSRVFSKEAGILRRWGTTILFATQAVRFLPSIDHIITLKEGHICEQGAFRDLVKSGGYVFSLHSKHTDRSDGDDSISPEEDNSQGLDNEVKKPKAAATTDKEDKRRQHGDWSVYTFFFRSLGPWFTLCLLVTECISAFFSTFPTVWLNWWSEANAKQPNQRVGFYLGVYAAMQVLAVLSFGLLVVFGYVYVAARTGIKLHQRLLQTVLWAPLSLFTNTDIGSITTRFSQDIALLDRSLPLALFVSISSLLVIIGRAALIASATPYAAASFPFLLAVFYGLQRAYLRTSRQLRLLDLEEKAPVYTQFLETLGGLATIRAFGWGPAALELNHRLVDRSQRPFYLLLMVQQWLTLVLDLVVAALAVLVAGLAVRLRASVSVGLTGVALVQLISFAETLKTLIQFWTSLETSIGAVARIKNFSEDTPDERLPGETADPGEQWPAAGRVEIRGVSASYDEAALVKALDGISLSVEPGQKIGICGRTGSGKSSLLLALLRLLDLSSGAILVDGVDLSTLPREQVRARLVAVAQDSFFLPGTVRQNIDPYDAAGDEAIAQALERVGLWGAIEEKGGLDAKFGEDMLSHGQRQLFSLARAVLRKGRGRVMLFDEATSSVDHQTDAQMQEVIRDEFREHTVISIAHRLETIADFDRVVVLEKGCVVEEGNPRELLASGKGKFRELWDASRHSGRVD